MKARERGMALLSVLLVMSVALLLSASMLRGHRLFIHSAAQQLDHLVLRDAALAGEALALHQLRQLQEGAAGRVSLDQPWARGDLRLALADAQVIVQIEDLAARFNLNTLLGDAVASQPLVERWARLATALDLPTIDWRAVGVQRLQDVSELLGVQGMTGDVLARLEPHVSLLPLDARLNVNTATALQLSALGLPAATAASVVERRPLAGYASLDAFLAQPSLDGLVVGAAGLGLASRWFRIRVQLQLGSRRLIMLSDVQLDAGSLKPNVLQRRLVAAESYERLP